LADGHRPPSGIGGPGDIFSFMVDGEAWCSKHQDETKPKICGQAKPIRWEYGKANQKPPAAHPDITNPWQINEEKAVNQNQEPSDPEISMVSRCAACINNIHHDSRESRPQEISQPM